MAQISECLRERLVLNSREARSSWCDGDVTSTTHFRYYSDERNIGRNMGLQCTLPDGGFGCDTDSTLPRAGGFGKGWLKGFTKSPTEHID